jgi:signal transduction histidine kinase
LNNAIKYSPHAEQVEVSLASSADEVRVSVRDFGIGISKEDQGKIFDRFYRVRDEPKKMVPGLGMGLYIVQEIIKQHGGEVTVTSEAAQGATFTVSLPLIN